MEFFIPSLIAGIITVASPCTITLLPVILSGSLANRNKWRPVVIVTSLGISVVVFGLLLRATTALIDVPQEFWNLVSGMIIFLLGYFMIFPGVWDRISARLKFSQTSNQALANSGQKEGNWGAILIGVSLGPVFSSCSPLYLFVLSSVIRESFTLGLINLILYATGLAVTLLVVALFGQAAVSKLKWLSNTEGLFRKSLGLIVIIAGFMIIFGIDKDIQAYLVESGLNLSTFDYNFLPEV